jgi:hypothetical protein
MLNHDQDLGTLVAAKTPQLTVPPPRLAPGRFLAPLSPAIASWHHRPTGGAARLSSGLRTAMGRLFRSIAGLPGFMRLRPSGFTAPARTTTSSTSAPTCPT